MWVITFNFCFFVAIRMLFRLLPSTKKNPNKTYEDIIIAILILSNFALKPYLPYETSFKSNLEILRQKRSYGDFVKSSLVQLKVWIYLAWNVNIYNVALPLGFSVTCGKY